ncbi:MAG: hypothetical protein ACYC0X_04825 [Pirellulaceae bacterium]
MGASPYRNAQFENIGFLKADYFDSDDPFLSMEYEKEGSVGQLCAQAIVVRHGSDGDA